MPGVAPFFVDGQHGFAVPRDRNALAAAIRRLARMPADQRRGLGDAARRAAQAYDVSRFVDNWRAVYREVLSETAEVAPTARDDSPGE